MADDLRVREYIDFVMEHDTMRPGRAGAEQAPSKRANRESERGAGVKGQRGPRSVEREQLQCSRVELDTNTQNCRLQTMTKAPGRGFNYT